MRASPSQTKDASGPSLRKTRSTWGRKHVVRWPPFTEHIPARPGALGGTTASPTPAPEVPLQGGTAPLLGLKTLGSEREPSW